MHSSGVFSTRILLLGKMAEALGLVYSRVCLFGL